MCRPRSASFCGATQRPAGAQPKLLLALLGDRWEQLIGGAPSTHILKPTGRWVLSADNECVIMTLAGTVGATRSPVWVETFIGRRALVAERFDRRVNGSQVDRIHQEDLCQAVELRPRDKYRTGRLSEKARQIIRDKSSDPSRGAREQFRQMLFRAIVGDEDGHGKNYGFMLRNGAVALAPCMTRDNSGVQRVDRQNAAPIGSQHYLEKVDIHALLEERRTFRCGEREARDIVGSGAVDPRRAR